MTEEQPGSVSLGLLAKRVIQLVSSFFTSFSFGLNHDDNAESRSSSGSDDGWFSIARG